MGQLHDIAEEIEERVILLSVEENPHDDTEACLEELEELAKTAGAIVVGKMIQKREKIHPGTYIGKGKIEELRILVDSLEASSVVCDDELSPAQLKNLEELLQIKVIDRTIMILDIFAKHATTREGNIQVELAQLKYRATRLVGLRSSLSRLGGGIGTRGPGEKKLEMDRRLIRERISILKKELDGIQKAREVARKQRSKNPIPVVSIVGYTNAGKSTLLNTLTNANVLEEDKLFATLDPTTRKLKLESGQQLLLTDTVGFIRKLPHHLIEAFRSTLEEAKYADLILHVVDSTSQNADAHMHTVYETLDMLGAGDKPVITLFNKVDKLEEPIIIKDMKADVTLRISAKKQMGLTETLQQIEEMLKKQKVYLEQVFSYADAGKIQAIRKYGQLLEETYREDGIFVRGYLPNEIYQRLH
ncbi:MAG: GTPase HflX [Lachnospiraceae bacterium]|nr:GTPase HflX [Lachnospiraceae bacterium]